MILRVSRPRNYFGVGVTVLLGVLLIWISIIAPPASLFWLFVLLVTGAASIWAGVRLAGVSGNGLKLTENAIVSLDGEVLCRLEDIRKVDRGFAAFKPAGGFLIRLHTKGARAWVPGLWWRLGKTVGVGGVIRAGEGRAMAELIIAMQAQQSTR